MISKEDIDKLYERSLTYPNEDRFFFVDDALDLAEQLLKERDEALRLKNAYREVLVSLGRLLAQPGQVIPIPNLPMSDKEVETWVDTEAQKLLGAKE